MTKYSGYQTITHPDGTKIYGVFNTDKYFENIHPYIDIPGKNILDVGCNDGMYSILAYKKGARSITLIDNEKIACENASDLMKIYNVPFQVICTDIIDYRPTDYHNIAFFFMVLHWIQDPFKFLRNLLPYITDSVAIIYRTANNGYEIPTNGYWFPIQNERQNELDQIMDICGFDKVISKKIDEQDNNKEIWSAIYNRRRSSFIIGEIVYKYNTILNKIWQDRLSQLLNHVEIPLFIKLLDYGYAIKYIDGIDLYGDRPFRPSHIHNKYLELSSDMNKNLINWYMNILTGCKNANYYLYDITPRNVIMKDEKFYLIDLDGIIPINMIIEPFYQYATNQWLKYLKINYNFTGNIDDLIDKLKNN